MKTYNLPGRKNMTALIAPGLLKDWRDATATAGLNQTQAFTMGLTLLFSDPAKWIEVQVPGVKPKTANFHVRVQGIHSAYIDEISHGMKIKRLAKNDPSPVSQTDVIEAVLVLFIDLTRSGRLLSL